MVIDAAKGIEPRTRKLFEVCRLRDIPIITFINKMDRESRDPFELIDEIEKTLALDSRAGDWPVGAAAIRRHRRRCIRRRPVFLTAMRALCGPIARNDDRGELAALNPHLDAPSLLGDELDLVRRRVQAA